MAQESDHEIARILAEDYKNEPLTSTSSNNWPTESSPRTNYFGGWEMSLENIPSFQSLRLRENDDVELLEPELETSRQDLEQKLQLYGMKEKVMNADGNCQFSSLSDQIYSSSSHHGVIRRIVVERLRTHSELYRSYIHGDYEEYVQEKSENGKWGDHITLKAAADHFGVRIYVLTSFQNESFIQVEPEELRSQRCLYISFWAEVHYNSIYPVEDQSSHNWQNWNPLVFLLRYVPH